MDWRKVVSAVAPTLATALGGPLAGVAVKQIGAKLLGRETATETEVQAAVAGATAGDLIKLKELEQEFAKQMADAGIQLEQLEASDRASARAMQMALKDRTVGLLAFAFVAGFFLTLTAIIFVQIPAAAERPLDILLGVEGSAVVTILTFYFGSSKGSQEKNAILGRATESRR